MKHTLVARVQDQPGVLNRVASLFRRRAFNIESLTVGGSESPDFSRMTIVVDTARAPVHIVAANLRKLVPVVEVSDVTDLPTVTRDLALIRVRCGPGERLRSRRRARASDRRPVGSKSRDLLAGRDQSVRRTGGEL